MSARPESCLLKIEKPGQASAALTYIADSVGRLLDFAYGLSVLTEQAEIHLRGEQSVLRSGLTAIMQSLIDQLDETLGEIQDMAESPTWNPGVRVGAPNGDTAAVHELTGVETAAAPPATFGEAVNRSMTTNRKMTLPDWGDNTPEGRLVAAAKGDERQKAVCLGNGGADGRCGMNPRLFRRPGATPSTRPRPSAEAPPEWWQIRPAEHPPRPLEGVP